MLGSDTGRARIRFKNANGSQQHVMQNYRGITYEQSTNLITPSLHSRKVQYIYNLLGKEDYQNNNQIRIYIYDDGTIEKRITIE
jgi:hypothetical protein